MFCATVIMLELSASVYSRMVPNPYSIQARYFRLTVMVIMSVFGQKLGHWRRTTDVNKNKKRSFR